MPTVTCVYSFAGWIVCPAGKKNKIQWKKQKLFQVIVDDHNILTILGNKYRDKLNSSVEFEARVTTSNLDYLKRLAREQLSES